MVKSHGLSVWTDDKTGTVTVAVITHPDFSDDRVEFFTFYQDERRLKHTHSVTEPSLYKHVYLAEFMSSTVNVYKRNEDNSVTIQQSVYLDSHVDNIEVDWRTGNLWIGSHYILHDIANFLSTYEKNKEDARGMISPSQVFNLKTSDDLITDIIEVFLNNGTEITGSSIAAVYGNKMIVGSIASETIVCDLIYSD